MKSGKNLMNYPFNYIEFSRNDGKLTGISITKSKYYILVDQTENVYYLIETKKLKELCDKNNKIFKSQFNFSFLISKAIFIKNSIKLYYHYYQYLFLFYFLIE